MKEDTAHTEITFTETTQEGFEAFADEVAEALPDAVVEFQDKPLFGPKYAIVRVKQEYGHYPLVVDEGNTFCIGDERAWVRINHA